MRIRCWKMWQFSQSFCVFSSSRPPTRNHLLRHLSARSLPPLKPIKTWRKLVISINKKWFNLCTWFSAIHIFMKHVEKRAFFTRLAHNKVSFSHRSHKIPYDAHDTKYFLTNVITTLVFDSGCDPHTRQPLLFFHLYRNILVIVI